MKNGENSVLYSTLQNPVSWSLGRLAGIGDPMITKTEVNFFRTEVNVRRTGIDSS